MKKDKFTKVKFRLDTPIKDMVIENNLVGKPIINNEDGNVIGVISKVENHGFYCECECIIWKPLFETECNIHDDTNSVEICNLVLDI